MRARIAALIAASAGVVMVTAAPSWAAPAAPTAAGTVCAAQVNRPCAWQERGAAGVHGVAQITAAHPGQLTLVRVEIKTQRAWGSPWETVASSTRVAYGSVRVSTPQLTAEGPTVICATGGPALEPGLQTTVCTTPY